MDPQARHLVWDLLRAARADGVSILLTTHLLDEAELLADRVVIIDHGRVVADGDAGRVDRRRTRTTPVRRDIRVWTSICSGWRCRTGTVEETVTGPVSGRG